MQKISNKDSKREFKIYDLKDAGLSVINEQAQLNDNCVHTLLNELGVVAAALLDNPPDKNDIKSATTTNIANIIQENNTTGILLENARKIANSAIEKMEEKAEFIALNREEQIKKITSDSAGGILENLGISRNKSGRSH